MNFRPSYQCQPLVHQNLKAFLGEKSTNAQRPASYWPCLVIDGQVTIILLPCSAAPRQHRTCSGKRLDMTQLLLSSKFPTLNTQFQDGSLRRPLAATSSVENIPGCSGSTRPQPNPLYSGRLNTTGEKYLVFFSCIWEKHQDKVSLICFNYNTNHKIYLALQGFSMLLIRSVAANYISQHFTQLTFPFPIH